MNYDGQEKYPDGFRWSALAERGRTVVRSTRGAADTFTTLRSIGLWLRSKRNPRVISISRPNMSKACVALKALKCSMIQNKEVEASHFLEELEDCLKRGDAGVVMVRLVIRSLLREGISREVARAVRKTRRMQRMSFHCPPIRRDLLLSNQ